MTEEDHHLGKVFKSGVQVGYKRNKNLREILCHSRLYPQESKRPVRCLNGFKTCTKNCESCKYSQSTSEFKSFSTGEKFKIQQKITCSDTNVIYLISCKLCGHQYIGKTSGQFKIRMNAHRSSIKAGSSGVAMHFCSKGHKLHHFNAIAIEKVFGDIFTLGVRERFWMNKLNCISEGLNTNRTNK